MKKVNFITLVLVLVLFNSFAQKGLKKYILPCSAMLVSGAIDGTIESASHHYYNGFKARFPNANDQFWNPEKSWKNKYLNGNPSNGPKHFGSTNVFVFTTDAYHLLRTSKRVVNTSTIIYYMEKNKDCVVLKKEELKQIKRKKFKESLKHFAALTVSRCIGFHLTYSVLFKTNRLIKV